MKHRLVQSAKASYEDSYRSEASRVTSLERNRRRSHKEDELSNRLHKEGKSASRKSVLRRSATREITSRGSKGATGPSRSCKDLFQGKIRESSSSSNISIMDPLADMRK